MRGWPILQAAVAFLILFIAGYPLRYLTAYQPEVQRASQKNIQEEKVTVAMTFTQPPEKFSLKYLGKEILANDGAGAFESTAVVSTSFPEEGIDLVFDGTWPEHFRKVGASVAVTRQNGFKQSQTLWGAKEISEVLTFSGKAEP